MMEEVAKNIPKKRDLTKEEKIKKEIRKLNAIFKNVAKDNGKIVESLIANAAFMSASLEELMGIINEKGYVETYKNGKEQHGIKKSSEIEIYNTMIKNYTSTINSLINLLPNDKDVEVKKAGEELAKFLSKGKPTGRVNR